MSTSSGDELSLRHLQQETQRRCISTGTSITVDELHKQGHRPPCQHCNCRDSTVFCTDETQAPVVVQQRASQTCPRTTPMGSRRSSAQFALCENLQQETQATTCTTGTSTPVSALQLRMPQLLHCQPQTPGVKRNGHVNSLVQELHLWKYTA